MPRVLIAGGAAAVLVLVAIGLLAFITDPGESAAPRASNSYVPIVPAEETCEVIGWKLESLRKQSSGGACEETKDCAIIGQACVSVPNVEAAEANTEFDRLLDKAKKMNCNVDYLICEFVMAACRGGQCVIERAVLEPPNMPSQ